MIHHLFTATLLVASGVSALSISSTCQTALTQVAANKDANACLGVSSLLSVVLQSNASIITPVDNWLKSLCAAPTCSNATLSAVVTNVTTGCSAELSSAGGSDGTASSITGLVEQYYPTARQIVCLTDSGTNCVTQTLTNIQNILGTLSLNNIGTIITTALSTTTIPSNVTCTDCTKEAYNILNKNFPSLVSSEASAVQSECGSSFTDGATPANIVESATTSGTTPNSATGPMMTRGALTGLGVSVLVVATSVLAFWA
ncbi:hypothetical protein B0H10DRAFT_2001654 [Mycena sp. CBHHK59/15]|nr:hypothetical protein B0H10DRAFT_2001654 [Mycena sp. CBHHK59/15]